jgi:hypothetical protein
MGLGRRDDAAKTENTEKARRKAAALQEKAAASYGAGKLAAAVQAPSWRPRPRHTGRSAWSQSR